MFDVSKILRQSIESSLAEWDDIGKQEFLLRHGLHAAFKFVIVFEGRIYDAKAVLVRSARRQTNDNNIALAEFGTTEDTIARPLRRLGFVVRDKERTDNRFWWVNQNKTREEFIDGYMWSPLSKSNGTSNPYYEFMSETQPGDGVISYWSQKIQGFGTVSEAPQVSIKPPYRQRETWSDRGWLVDVHFSAFLNPFEPRDYLIQIKPLLPQKNSPLQSNGSGREFYLTEISEELFALLCRIGGNPVQSAFNSGEGLAGRISNKFIASESLDDEHEREIKSRTDFVGPLEKERIQKSRRGQGVFRQNVRAIERRCRVTGVRQVRHLRASHIKPWRLSNDREKLDGNNGLLLSPHVDQLFDGGWITFTDAGELLRSSRLDRRVLESWMIPEELNVGAFNEEQKSYLAFHRKSVFKQ
jgi:putative restriction endonuclease